MTYLISAACELEQIMTRYDFLEARIVSLSNVRTDSNLTWFTFGELLIYIGEHNDQLCLPGC